MMVLILSAVLLAILGRLTPTAATDPHYSAPRTQPFPPDYPRFVVHHLRPRMVGLSQKKIRRVRSCNLSFINGAWFNRKITVRQGQTIGLGGSLFDHGHKEVPANSWVIIAPVHGGKAYQAPARFRFKQPLIQALHGGGKAYAYTGFLTNVDSSGLPTGDYDLYIVYREGKVFYTCNKGSRISIIEPGQSRQGVTGGRRQ